MPNEQDMMEELRRVIRKSQEELLNKPIDIEAARAEIAEMQAHNELYERRERVVEQYHQFCIATTAFTTVMKREGHA